MFWLMGRLGLISPTLRVSWVCTLLTNLVLVCYIIYTNSTIERIQINSLFLMAWVIVLSSWCFFKTTESSLKAMFNSLTRPWSTESLLELKLLYIEKKVFKILFGREVHTSLFDIANEIAYVLTTFKAFF